VTLSCGHKLCSTCCTTADASGIASCPLCRTPHLLDPRALSERKSAYQSSYQEWRSGSAKGAAGELASISLPRRPGTPHTKLGMHVSSAGDLAILGECTCAPALDTGGDGTLGFAIVGASAFGGFDPMPSLDPPCLRSLTPSPMREATDVACPPRAPCRARRWAAPERSTSMCSRSAKTSPSAGWSTCAPMRARRLAAPE